MEQKNESISCPITGCGFVGYAYVPYQQSAEVFSPEEALSSGTLFPELSLTISEYGKIGKQTGGVVNE